MAYTIIFAESVNEQLKKLTARQRAVVLDEIETQLLHEPLVETRNRKKLRPNPIAPWELRIGKLRVFFDVKHTDLKEVHVLAIGIKERNKVVIAGREIPL